MVLVAEEEEVARRDRDGVVEDGSEFLGFDDAITFDDAISGETFMFFSFRFFSFAVVFIYILNLGICFGLVLFLVGFGVLGL